MINLATFRILVSIILLAMISHSSAESAPEHFEAAIYRFNNKEYNASVILLKNALREDPQHLPSRILLGKSLIRTGDVAGAEKDLKIALEFGADESLVVTPLGSAYLIQGKYQQLLDEIRSGSRSTEVEKQVLVLRAYAQIQLGDLNQAEQDLTRARRLMPNDPRPMLGLATVAIRQGDLNKAEQFIALAQNHQPDESEILFAQGEILRLKGEVDSAIQLFNQSIALEPQKIQARLSQAALLINRSDGDLNDWLGASDSWTALPDDRIKMDVNKDGTARGWGGQSYDAERLLAAVDWSTNKLHVAVITGLKPWYGSGSSRVDTGSNGNWRPGDLAIYTGQYFNYSDNGGTDQDALWDIYGGKISWTNNDWNAHANGVGEITSNDGDLYGLRIPDDYNHAGTGNGDTGTTAVQQDIVQGGDWYTK